MSEPRDWRTNSRCSAALIVAALLLFPGIVLAQPRPGPSDAITPGPPLQPGASAVTIDPRTPPPPTIPSSPPIDLPPPSPLADRPRSLFNIRPVVEVSEEWTDNFNRSAKDARSNFRSSVSPGVVVTLDDPTLTGHFTYKPRGFHDTFPNEFGVHHSLAGLISWAATSRLRLTSVVGFAQTDDPARADTLGLQRGREEFTRTNASLAADYVLPLLTTTASYRVSRFDGNDQSTTSHMIGGGATVTLARIHTLTGGYEYLSTETDNGTGAAIGATGDSTTRGHQLTGTFSREISSTVVAGVTTAYAWRDQTRSTGDADFSRWNISIFNNYVLPQKIQIQGNVGVAHLSGSAQESQFLTTSTSNLSYWLGSAVLGLGIERGFSETFADGQDAGVVKTSAYSASISYRFTPLLSATGSARYRENEPTGEGTTAPRQEKTTEVSAQAIYQMFRWLTSTLEYTYAKTTSSEADRGFVENRVRASLNAVFD